jgi:hypothetical protein
VRVVRRPKRSVYETKRRTRTDSRDRRLNYRVELGEVERRRSQPRIVGIAPGPEVERRFDVTRIVQQIVVALRTRVIAPSENVDSHPDRESAHS